MHAASTTLQGESGEWVSMLQEGAYLTLPSYSILPAISLNGMLYCEIVEGAFNTELFTKFIEGLLEHMNPFPEPNSVIVMDNCAIHKAPEIRELIESRCVSNPCFTLDVSD